MLLPEVAIEATKDCAAEPLRTIEQTAQEMFRENPDLLALPVADEIRNNGELPQKKHCCSRTISEVRRPALEARAVNQNHATLL